MSRLHERTSLVPVEVHWEPVQKSKCQQHITIFQLSHYALEMQEAAVRQGVKRDLSSFQSPPHTCFLQVHTRVGKDYNVLISN